MNKHLKGLMLLSLLAGYFFGILPSASAALQFSFAGYSRSAANTGARAHIAYKNPFVAEGSTSSEWVMSGGSGGDQQYIQAGWIKVYNSTPYYFGEYGCPSVCRFMYGVIPVGTTHRFEVSNTYVPSIGYVWCIKIDGVCKTSISGTTVGFVGGDSVLYDGESHDTTDNIGGTSTSHLRMSRLEYYNTSRTWVGVDTTLLTSNTTGGTRYRTSKGFSSTISAYVDNWSVP